MLLKWAKFWPKLKSCPNFFVFLILYLPEEIKYFDLNRHIKALERQDEGTRGTLAWPQGKVWSSSKNTSFLRDHWEPVVGKWGEPVLCSGIQTYGTEAGGRGPHFISEDLGWTPGAEQSWVGSLPISQEGKKPSSYNRLLGRSSGETLLGCRSWDHLVSPLMATESHS